MHELEQGISNVVPLRPGQTVDHAVACRIRHLRVPRLSQNLLNGTSDEGLDQWQPIGKVVRRLMARMFVEQDGAPHG